MIIKKDKAFTIIELMTVVAIVAIVAAIATPSLRNMILNNRLASFSNDFVASISQARGEAIKNRAQVVIQPINNNWSNGWQIVVDTNGNGSFSDDDDEQVRALALSSDLDLQGTPASLIINSNGSVNGFTWSGITVCDSRGKGRTINVSGAGISSIDKSPSCS